MKNYVDAMADAIVDVLQFSNSEVEWPDMDALEADPEIKPEWFYPALQGNDSSEMMSILEYTQMAGLFDEQIGNLMLGVALVEMKHFANIRDTVIAMGGTLPQPLDTKTLELGSNAGEALAISVHNEIATINFYESLLDKVTSTSVNGQIVRQMLVKLIADESLHLKLFAQELVKMKLSQRIESLRSQIDTLLKKAGLS